MLSQESLENQRVVVKALFLDGEMPFGSEADLGRFLLFGFVCL